MSTVTTQRVGQKRKQRKLLINELREREDLSEQVIDEFLAQHQAPLVEGAKCTFLFRGEVDEVWVKHRIVNQPQRVAMKRIPGFSLWWVVIELPEGSRVDYHLETRVGEHHSDFNDPLNPNLASSPLGSSSVAQAAGYKTPEWTKHDPQCRQGELHTIEFYSKALRRNTRSRVYLPARYRKTSTYPLLVVHDGDDYINHSAMRTVLDNLIHRLDMAETVVVFSNPGDRIREYPNYAAHARHITTELIPYVAERVPLIDRADARALMGASFGAVASFSVAYRNPEMFGSLILQSGSFVFTDIGNDHKGGPAFDPVVKFMNRYREKPSKVADNIYMSCGVYEELIVPNRSMVPVFEGTGMTVRYVEARDGHSWENWRDRLQDALSWIYPGPQRFVYE